MHTVQSMLLNTWHPSDFEVRPQPIASGSYGVVRLATHKHTHGIYAVKSLPHKHAFRSSLAQSQVIANELHNQASVSRNRYVCTLFGKFEDENCTHAVQELCTGGSLYDSLLVPATHVPYKMHASIARGLLCALCECCDKGIIHGDIKPGNIMFSNMEQSEIRLIDFGSSSVCTSNASVRCIFGTPAYAAPEIVTNGLCNQMSDTWSVGIVLHQLLTGSTIPTLAALHAKGGNINSIVDLEFPAGTSMVTKDLIHCMLQPNPQQRMHPYEALGHPYFRVAS